MLKNKTKIIAIFIILFLSLLTTNVFAYNEFSDEEIMPISDNITINKIEEDPIVDTYKSSDVYLYGDEIIVDYIIDGNLFVFANKVTINSQIGGDAFILADTLIIEQEGYIFSNLFAIAKSIEVKGNVYDTYALSQNFTISGGFIYRDLKVTCDTLNINGSVNRNAFVNCNIINFNTDNNSNGIISGNLNYSSDKEFSMPNGVIIGETNYTQFSLYDKSVPTIISEYILNLGNFLSFVLIFWLICLLLTPRFLQNTNQIVRRNLLSVFGYGILSLIVMPIACIILILLKLTSGFSLVLLTLYILAIVISKSLFIITANNYVCSKLKINKNLGIFGMLIVSGAIIWLFTKLPYIGGIISFITVILGLGILVISIIPKKAQTTEIQESIVEVSENSKDNA